MSVVSPACVASSISVRPNSIRRQRTNLAVSASSSSCFDSKHTVCFTGGRPLSTTRSNITPQSGRRKRASATKAVIIAPSRPTSRATSEGFAVMVNTVVPPTSRALTLNSPGSTTTQSAMKLRNSWRMARFSFMGYSPPSDVAGAAFFFTTTLTRLLVSAARASSALAAASLALAGLMNSNTS
jgi:hypothetical protein